MTPGERLSQWRLRAKLSQAAAAAALARHLPKPSVGVAQTTWASWELGTKAPGLAHAFAIEALTEGLIPAVTWSRPRRRPRRPPARSRPPRRAA